jgi:hypothetical protein
MPWPFPFLAVIQYFRYFNARRIGLYMVKFQKGKFQIPKNTWGKFQNSKFQIPKIHRGKSKIDGLNSKSGGHNDILTLGGIPAQMFY